MKILVNIVIYYYYYHHHLLHYHHCNDILCTVCWTQCLKFNIKSFE